MRENKKSKRTKITLSQSATINDLTDDILSHILSFLPIKDAFRTSILSKRWATLCYSLSVLYFDDNVKIHLPQFMNSVLFSPHSQNRPLESLTLKFPSYSMYLDDTADCFTFDIWIEALKRRKVEKLDLSYLYYIPLVPTIFCCKTLVVLKLTGITVATMFHCSVDLPLLKDFYLSNVRFEHMNNLMKILSGCPKLLKLETRKVVATTGVTTGGCIKPLSNLFYAYIGLFEVPLRAVSNVEILSVMKIQMKGSLPNEEINSYYKGYPVFENLLVLQLSWLDFGILDWDYDVMTMLQNCPKLKAFVISKYAKGKVDWKYPDHVPECVSSHLTTCFIYDYHAVEADFRFATYILQNANFLQVMNIHHSKKLHSMESPQYLEDLSSCPRISPDCKLSLKDDALFRYF